MNVIRVADIIENAFSSNQAEILKEEIQKYLDENKEVCLDFDGIDKFTTLFFNFSTGYFISRLGKEQYDKLVTLKNLTALGESTYNNSYQNAIRDDYENAVIENKIIDILNNLDEV